MLEVSTKKIEINNFFSERLDSGKLGRVVVKTLIISDNQAFHDLIIKPFDKIGHTIDKKLLSTINKILIDKFSIRSFSY